jgi:hypothetical protein
VSCLQSVTTALRDAVHRASEGVTAAGNAAANAAGAAVEKTKEALQVGAGWSGCVGGLRCGGVWVWVEGVGVVRGQIRPRRCGASTVGVGVVGVCGGVVQWCVGVGGGCGGGLAHENAWSGVAAGCSGKVRGWGHAPLPVEMKGLREGLS